MCTRQLACRISWSMRRVTRSTEARAHGEILARCLAILPLAGYRLNTGVRARKLKWQIASKPSSGSAARV
jgi:hypothetical protein